MNASEIKLTLRQWKDIIHNCGLPTDVPRAFRCENTPLTIARHYGGITYNGKTYMYFEPWDNGGSAMLLVREDVVKYVCNLLNKRASAKADTVQEELGL